MGQQGGFYQKEGMFGMVHSPVIPGSWYLWPVQSQWTGLICVTNKILQEWQSVTSKGRSLGGKLVVTLWWQLSSPVVRSTWQETKASCQKPAPASQPPEGHIESRPSCLSCWHCAVTAWETPDQDHLNGLNSRPTRSCEKCLLSRWAAAFGVICYTAPDNKQMVWPKQN